MKKFVGLLIGIIFLLFIGNQAMATTMVNVNAKVGEIDVTLDAGSYTVTPVDNRGDGGYMAWSGWSSGSKWLNYYVIIAGGTAIARIDELIIYQSMSDAFAAASSVYFTLDAETLVTFDFQDGVNGDNRGGMSFELDVTTVPEPATMLLFGIGLLGLAGVNRRKV